VFFDALGIAWEYEAEGYVLSDGAATYLPDFWLPTFHGGMYAEVKPLGGDFSKARQFTLDKAEADWERTDMWLAEGTPDMREYDVLTAWYDMPCGGCEYGDKEREDGEPFCFPTGAKGCLRGVWRLEAFTGVPNWCNAEGENRMFTDPQFDTPDRSMPPDMRWAGGALERAVVAARRARFEHGEHGISQENG
jgi:hypothetical protein